MCAHKLRCCSPGSALRRPEAFPAPIEPRFFVVSGLTRACTSFPTSNQAVRCVYAVPARWPHQPACRPPVYRLTPPHTCASTTTEMGPKNFIPHVDYASQKVLLRRECAGKCIAVDAMIPLFRYTRRHAYEVVLKRQYDNVIKDMMSFLSGIRLNGATPIVVLDGRPVPAKAAEQARRRLERDAAAARVTHAVQAKTDPTEADVLCAAAPTPDMLLDLVNAMRQAGQQYVVAPYESDAQLVYLARQGIVQHIMSDDGDIICLLPDDGGCQNKWGVLRNYDTVTHAADLVTSRALCDTKKVEVYAQDT